MTSDSALPTSPRPVLEAVDIMGLLPHRYPFLLVDRIVDIRQDESATGIKNVTINEPFFPGHFPDQPIMPGVLVIEAMAQTSGAIVVNAMPPQSERPGVYFMSVESARFRRPVLPGHTLHIRVRKLRQRATVWKYSGEVYVDDKLAAEAEYTAMVGPRTP